MCGISHQGGEFPSEHVSGIIETKFVYFVLILTHSVSMSRTMYVGKEKRKDFLEGRKDREMEIDPSFSF